MKRVKIELMDLLVVLEAMNENGTKDIIFLEHAGLPAIADADEPENLITFQTFDSDEEAANEDGEMH